LLTASQRDVLALLFAAKLPNPLTAERASIWVGSVQAAAEMSFAPTPLENARLIINVVLALPTPAQLIAVITEADNAQSGFQSLLDLKARLEADPSQWAPTGVRPGMAWSIDSDPLIVDDGRPFVDRKNFRDLLPRLHKLNTPTCLLIEGDEGTGKSYLHEFCKSCVKGRKGSFFVGYTKLGSNELATSPARLPAMDIASGLETALEAYPAEQADPHRDAKNLAAWIINFTPKRAVPGLAVFDDVGTSGVDEAVHTLIYELIESIQKNPPVADRLRVVLIGYDPQRLVAKNLQYATHILEHVDTPQIDEWLRMRYPNRPDYLRAAAPACDRCAPICICSVPADSGRFHHDSVGSTGKPVSQPFQEG
jgi:hypothetical protein